MEGTSKATITFTNPSTGEYAYYELTAKTLMAEVLETINIESPARQTARSVITLENPLGVTGEVTMGSAAKPSEWWTCDCRDIKLNELSAFTNNTEANFEVEYRPLMPTSQPTEHLLTIITKELGTFKYKIVVKSSPSLLKQILRFEVPLGSIQNETFVFHAYNTVKCDFACEVKKPDFFSVQKALTVEPVAGGWAGDSIRLSVGYEPTEIGELRDMLVVQHPEWGYYECELVATCVPPMPQGPFNITQGAGALDVPFRNCFTSSCAWTFTVDHPAYRLGAPTATVNAKTQGNCQVFFEPKEEHMNTPGGFITAKLFITCSLPAATNLPPWVFYLRGKIDANAPPPKGKK